MGTLLLPSDVVKRSIMNDGTARRKPGTKTAQRWRFGLVGQWLSSVEHPVLYKDESVAVESVHATLGDDIDRSTRPAAGLGGQTVVHDLKFLHRFRRQFGTSRACEFVVVFYPVDVKAVTSRP